MQYFFERNRNLKDSNAYDSRFSKLTKINTGSITLKAGFVIKIHEEPKYKTTLVSVQLIDGGIIEEVPFPTPNIITNEMGKITGKIKMIHGLYEPIMPGQYVLVGFIDGNSQKPIIINKYQYKAIPSTGSIDNLFTNPLSKLNFQSSDIILGHYSGSYLSIHAKTPIPGHVQISSISSMELKSKLGIVMKSDLEVNIKAGKTPSENSIKLDSKVGKIEVQSSSQITMKSGQSPMDNVIKLDSQIGKIEVKSTSEITIKSGQSPIDNIIKLDSQIGKIEIQSSTIEIKPKAGGMVKLGSNPTNYCNNLPNCLFTGAPHSTSTDVLV
jgi:hypothetical protein